MDCGMDTMNPRRMIAFLLTAMMLIAARPVCHAVDRDGYGMPYYITVDITNQIVTVYDAENDAVVRQMLCSSGKNITPTGTFTLPRGRADRDRKPWYYIAMYHRYVKYATRITGMILFHSLPYTRQSLQSIDITLPEPEPREEVACPFFSFRPVVSDGTLDVPANPDTFTALFLVDERKSILVPASCAAKIACRGKVLVTTL